MATVRDEDVERYVRTFHETFRETATKFLSATDRGRLMRWDLLDRPVVAYVSTMSGVALEYRSEGPPISIVKGSAPVVRLMFRDAPRRLRRLAIARGHNISNSGIEGGTFVGALPVELTGSFTFRIVNVRVEGGDVAPGYRRVVDYAEFHSNRSLDYWSSAAAVGRAKDEILQALTDLAVAKEHEISFDALVAKEKERRVLVLGDFSENGRERIERISRALVDLGYWPFTASEVADLPDLDLRQKISLLGLTSRFVVIDDSSKAGHLTEIALIQQTGVIAIVLRLEGSDSSFMSQALDARSSVILEVEYGVDTLPNVVGEAVAWAEERFIAIAKRLDSAYPWRPQST